VCVFSIRECEACVNVNLTLPVLPFARRVCVCVNVNLTLPVLPFARRVCACVNVNLTLPVLPSTGINKQICGTSRKAVACVCVWMRSVCEWEACANVILKLPVLASA
jgi:hypothetical protein